jgi:hypothetical protein
MTDDIKEKMERANKSVADMSLKLKAYKESLGLAASSFEELASACAAVISQPYIEVDTRDIDG